MITRNLSVFYALIFIPLIALIVEVEYELISSVTFASLLMSYAFIYHPFIGGLRLLALNKTDQKSFWQVFIPFRNMKYFKALFF